MEMQHLAVLEAGRLRSGVGRAVPPKAVRENLFAAYCPASSGLVAIFDVFWLVLASPDLCLHLHLVFSP